MAMKENEIDLEKLKECELNILKHFICICESLNLKYYLIGGTLLGAVRHKGFIPWDDDIDVGMPRRDYEIFLKKAQGMLPEKYFVQTHISDPEYPNCFAKIRDNDTTFLETSSQKLKMNHGVFIDIFPLDVYPDHQLSMKWLDFVKDFCTVRIQDIFQYEKPIERTTMGKIRLAISKICFPDYRKAVSVRDRVLKSVKKGNKYANHGGAWGKKEIVPIEWYGEGIELDFEGIRARGPVRYDLWLSQVYGKYMELPPIEKRVTHHYTEVIDLNKSFKNYI